MSKKWSRLILPVLLASELAPAAQLVQRSDSVPVQVTISAAEVNRLAVEGRKIVKVVPGQAGMLVTERDEALGVLYFRPMGANAFAGTVTLFVTDDQGDSYRLVLVPRPVSGEEIVIQPANPGAGTRNGGSARAPSYQRRIKNLVLGLATGEATPAGMTVAPEIPLWREARLQLTGRRVDGDLVGETYRLTNVADTGMLVEEQELYKKGVLAVCVAVHTLGPGESTALYVVKEYSGHE